MLLSYTKQLYKDSIIADMKQKFSYQNDIQVPKLQKVCLNVGIKAVDSDKKFLSYLNTQLSLISGQKSVLTKSNKAIATFKLKENMEVGCRVTLRGRKMYEFFDRLIYIALPRIRDFRGLSANGFNQSCHYSFGIKEHNVFLEVDLDNIVKIFGMNVTITTNAKTREEALYLLRKLNLPIQII